MLVWKGLRTEQPDPRSSTSLRVTLKLTLKGEKLSKQFEVSRDAGLERAQDRLNAMLTALPD